MLNAITLHDNDGQNLTFPFIQGRFPFVQIKAAVDRCHLSVRLPACLPYSFNLLWCVDVLSQWKCCLYGSIVHQNDG